MLKQLLSLSIFILLITGAGCDNKVENPFTPVEIPPPSEIADSLYIVTDSGLKFYDLRVGEGSLAEDGFAIEFHFILWLSDSTLVNSSYITGVPQVVVLGEDTLLPGWREGLDGMRTGGFRQLIIPPALAYGEEGSTSIGVPPNETVIMELALTGVGVVTGQ